MSILWLLIGLSLVLVLVIATVFIWALHDGQFDDLEGPGMRILAEDDGLMHEAHATQSSCQPSRHRTLHDRPAPPPPPQQ